MSGFTVDTDGQDIFEGMSGFTVDTDEQYFGGMSGFTVDTDGQCISWVCPDSRWAGVARRPVEYVRFHVGYSRSGRGGHRSASRRDRGGGGGSVGNRSLPRRRGFTAAVAEKVGRSMRGFTVEGRRWPA